MNFVNIAQPRTNTHHSPTRTATKTATHWLLRAFRWAAGIETPKRLPYDDLEPYCDEPTLKARCPAQFDQGEAHAIHKIGARYGAEL